MIHVAPGPLLAGFEGSDDRMSRLLEVCGGVTVGRAVTAADVTALEADPEVNPSVAALQAFLTTVDGFGQACDLDLTQVTARFTHAEIVACASSFVHDSGATVR